jgi:hypothetical protein
MRRRRSVLTLVGLALAATGPAGCNGGSDEPAAPKVAPGVARAAAFRVVYRVEDTAGDAARISTDVVQVALPWNSLLERRDGPPPGGAVLLSTVQNQRFTFNTAEGSSGYATRRIPGMLATAPSPEVLEAAERAGSAERLGEATVAGESCTRWAYLGVNKVLARATAEERVETCVTGDGIPLREAVTLRGKPVRVAEAVQVDRNPPVTAETYQTARDPGSEGDRGLLETEQQVTEEQQSGKEIVKLAAPEGFRATRQVTVLRQAGPSSPPISLYVQAFESGTDLVVTEQVILGSPPWSAGEGTSVDLGAKREGKVVYRSGWAEVRVSVGNKSVRVSSARPSLALAVAETLRI